MKNQEYTTLRLLTILLGTLLIPVGTFVGYEFGAKHLVMALVGLAVQMTLAFVEAHVWWLTFEKGRDRERERDRERTVGNAG